jgi:hypothetical protein
MSDEEQLWNIINYGNANPLTPEVVSHFHEIIKKKSIRKNILETLEDSLIKIYIQQTSENYYSKSAMRLIANELLNISDTMNKLGGRFS